MIREPPKRIFHPLIDQLLYLRASMIDGFAVSDASRYSKARQQREGYNKHNQITYVYQPKLLRTGRDEQTIDNDNKTHVTMAASFDTNVFFFPNVFRSFFPHSPREERKANPGRVRSRRRISARPLLCLCPSAQQLLLSSCHNNRGLSILR